MFDSFIEALPDKVRSSDDFQFGTRFRKKANALQYRYVALNQLYRKFIALDLDDPLKNSNDFRGKMDVDQLSSDSAYKYFKRELAIYLKKNQSDSNYKTVLESVKSNYLSRSYFGIDYFEIEENYRDQETPLKAFVRDAFIATFPITPEMSKAEVAARNHKLGKISVSHWIGDIVNYDYFHQAPGFMMENVNRAIQIVEMFIFNLLNDSSLDVELMKLSTNQRLQVKLPAKIEQAKPKINKI